MNRISIYYVQLGQPISFREGRLDREIMNVPLVQDAESPRAFRYNDPPVPPRHLHSCQRVMVDREMFISKKPPSSLARLLARGNST
jgi:hypothetical protein